MAPSRVYLDGRLIADALPAKELAAGTSGTAGDALAGGGFGWLDVRPSDAETLDLVAAATGLAADHLVRAAEHDQRPTVEVAPHRLLLSLPLLRFDPGTGVVRSHGMGVLVTRQLLVTCMSQGILPLDEVETAWEVNSVRAGDGVQFLVHGLFSVYLRHLQESVEMLDRHVLRLEDRTVDADDAGVQAGEFRRLLAQRRMARRTLVRLRSVIMLLPSVVDTLNDSAASVGLPGYFTDHDRRVTRLVSRTEIVRETLTSLQEMELAAHGNQLNMVMRRLTAFAAIFAIIAAITGYYGMNVRTWPASSSTMGGVVALGLIIASVSGLLVLLRRRDWL